MKRGYKRVDEINLGTKLNIMRSVESLITSVLLLAATTFHLASGFCSFRLPILISSRSPETGSKYRYSSQWMVTSGHNVETGPLPELDKSGVYQTTNPEEHKYVANLMSCHSTIRFPDSHYNI